MPRNRYINEAHTEQRRLIEIQQEQMEKLESALRDEAVTGTSSLLPVVDPRKTLRRGRRRNAKKHKPARFRNAGTQSY